jgi:transposase
MGLMQADAYAGYDRLYAAARRPGPIVEAACWAHARRKFFDLARLNTAPIALEAVRQTDALFAIEREINGEQPAERRRVRQERSRPRVEALEAWLREQYARLSPASQVAKAIAYSLNRWDGLARFLDDGRLCMTNNAAERALRGIAVGRHNWTFAGSDAGGRRAAAIYTLIETAKLNDIDPQAWLADVITTGRSSRPADQRSPALATASTHRLSCLIEFGAASLATKARVECQWRRFHTD